MSIYSNLLAMGYSDEDIRAAAADVDLKPRTFGVVMQETDDGPIVGVAYRNNYRAEEEWGVASLTEALTGKDRWHPFILPGREAYFAQFSDVPGSSLVLSERPMHKPLVWGDGIFREGGSASLEGDSYAQWWENAVAHTQGLPDAFLLKYKSVKQLRELAVAAGVEKPARVKDALVSQIVEAAVPAKPNLWPGWFHYGRVLVLRADSGIVADVLTLLHVAALEGTLGFGSGGFGPFASGLSLYDAADIGPVYHRQLAEQVKFEKKHLRKLRGVRRKLEAAGWRVFTAEDPAVRDGVVQYWFVGLSPDGERVAKWVSLSELKGLVSGNAAIV